MNKRIVCIFIFALTAPCLALAFGLSDTVQVEVTGVIVAPACEVEAPVEVPLGEVSRQLISIPGGNSATKTWAIKLSQCSSVTTKATLVFSGTPYAEAEFATAIYANDISGGAEDIGLQIFNLDGKSLVNLSNGTSYELDIDPQTKSAELPLAARMYTPHGHPTAGEFRSSVTLNFIYQ